MSFHSNVLNIDGEITYMGAELQDNVSVTVVVLLWRGDGGKIV